MNPPSPDSSGRLPPALAFARLCQIGKVATVEEFLAREHVLSVTDQDLLDLIQQEILFREGRGEVPSADDYQRRFPAHADQVAALFAVNKLLGAPPAPGDDVEAPALPNYRVGERIGRGAIGAVFRAEDEVLQRPVAVKVLRPEWRDDPGRAGRFWAEAEVTAGLQHPGIVPVYEAGYDDYDRPYIAMKLIAGRSLDRLLADRKSPADGLPSFVKIFEQVCQAVAYAHARGVIHRDLKPANVMVGEFGEVQVMDWGLSKKLGERSAGANADTAAPTPAVDSTVPPAARTLVGEMIGTPAYAPPEQARGDHDRVGPASDVFGLGAVLCEILTGRPPYETTEAARAGDITLARSRLTSGDADPELVALALACLAANPKDRPATAAEVVAAVSGYQARLAERLRAAELAEARSTAERKARRRAEALRLIGVVTCALLGFAAWYWVNRQADLAREVSAAVDDGRALREESVRVGGDPARLAESDRAARRAEALTRGLVGRSGLRGQVAELLADLEADARDPDMVKRLERVRVERIVLGRDSFGTLNTAYADAFRTYGIDVVTGDPDELARRIAGRAIRSELVAALDHWASFAIRHESDKSRADHLWAIAKSADPDSWRNRLRDALRAKDDDALSAMAKEVGSAELPAASLTGFGRALALRPGKVADGVAVLREARRRYPGDLWANHDLAYFLCATNPPRFRETIPYFTAAVALRPDMAAIRINLGNAYRAAGDLDAAIEAHRGALAIEPGNAIAHNNLGNALREKGEINEAITHFREALRVDPRYAGPALRLGRSLTLVGDWDGALTAGELAAKLDPVNPDPVQAHADALVNVGRFGDAAQVYRDLHRSVAKMPQAEQIGRLAREAEKLERIAPTAADTSISKGSATEIWMRAWACYLTRRDAAAVRLAERALVEDPDREHAPGGEDHDVFFVFAAARATETEAERVRCRGLALAWLRAELARKSADIQTADPAKRLSTRRAVRIWQQHRSLAVVRDPAALSALPAEERGAWQEFWKQVADFVRQIDDPPT